MLELKVFSGRKLIIPFYLIMMLTLHLYNFFSPEIFTEVLTLFFYTIVTPIIFVINVLVKVGFAGFSINKNEDKETTFLVTKTDYTLINTAKPYFIDIFLFQKRKNRFKIIIENKGLYLGHYTLKNGEDLTKLIDGFTELLDLELYENNKLSDGEVLSFKSKNSAIEPHSGLWIRTPNNKLMISSLPNTSNWIELDLSQQILKNRKNEFELKEIEKIVIQDGHFGKMKMDIVTKKGKTKTIFKHQVSEITTIRDKKRLLETLQNQAVLTNIKIEVA